MSNSPSDLASALIAAEPAERERLLRAAAGPELELALHALGQRREVAAADVLSMVDNLVEERSLKKAARRELHRLRSVGIQPPQRSAPVAEPGPPTPHVPLPISQAWATDIDPSGSRMMWVLGERPLGGAWFGALVLNDSRGLLEMSFVETTRKRFVNELEDARREAGTWVSLPGDYALGLVREAVDLTREVDGGLPTRYQAFREVFGEAQAAPERALVYETISPVGATFNPTWLDDSPRLLDEPEAAGWQLAVPASFRARALDVARLPGAALLVPGHSPRQQAVLLLAEAAEQTLTPSVRRALRRRIEETAYIFITTDRLVAARLAVAAARPLLDETVSAERHPLVRLLLAAGLARLLGIEQVDGRPASEALLELVEEPSDDRELGGGIETRPSGLVIPR